MNNFPNTSADQRSYRVAYAGGGDKAHVVVIDNDPKGEFSHPAGTVKTACGIGRVYPHNAAFTRDGIMKRATCKRCRSRI